MERSNEAAGGNPAPAVPGVQVKAVQPLWKARQFHNQPERSHQHEFLVELWDAVRAQTDGKLAVTVHPLNDRLPGGDPLALQMLLSGELEFYTLNGNGIGKVVPPAEIQGVPYAFADSAQVHRANDGALGAYITQECAAKGIHRFPRGLMENGFRQICTFAHPIRHVDDLAGLKLRTPSSGMIRDAIASLGAEAVVVNLIDIHDALASRRVDGHENPLVIFEVNRFWDVTPYLSITNHMWTGFNVIGNLAFWDRLPPDVQAIVDANVTRCVAAQRAYTIEMNEKLSPILVGKGMILTHADTESFKRKLRSVGFYERWKAQVGSKSWALLEEQVGRVI